MDSEKIVRLLEKQFIKNNEIFFSYAWRENLNEYLTEESQYVILVQWIDKEIEKNQDIINAFNPADKFDGYTKGFFNTYKDACANIAMLLNMRNILFNTSTTKEMRKNIEDTICKIWNVKYDSNLKIYI